MCNKNFSCLIFLAGISLVSCLPSNPAKKETSFSYGKPVDLVNVFIDTHDSRWFYFNSASRPFGMVNLSPDTETHSDWGAGYLYDSKHIRCFSHIHAWQLSGIAVLPATGPVRGHLGMDVYKSSFSHDKEKAVPGYHKVYLDDYSILAELTSTNRVGFHRYQFERPDNPHIYFDLGAFLAFAPTTDTYLTMVSDTLLEGFTVMGGSIRRPKPVTVYFTAIFDQAFANLGGWKDGNLMDGKISQISGPGAGVFVTFPEGTKQVKLKVAISYTSIENSRLNMDTELAHWNFDRIVHESREEWNELLGRIIVEGGTRSQQVKFYTDLWRSLLGRRTVSDVNGNYIDNTGNEPVTRTVQTENGMPLYPHYNFDALWGCQWSLNLLWPIAYPEIMNGFANTMVDIYLNGGLIPRGPAGGNYSFVMIGDPASSFFATAYNQGIRDYDAEKAYEGIRKNAFSGGIRDRAGYEMVANPVGGGMDYYVDQGWVPEGIEAKHTAFHRHGAAMTLEYAYQDWCVAQFAHALGKRDDYELFMKRALNYRNIWNPENKFMHPREKGFSWIDDFKPVDSARHTRGFVEANSAIYTHYVPHDIQGLVHLYGGEKIYIDTLEAYFERSRKLSFVGTSKKMHASGWVNYGNQPGTGMAHIFNHAGAPWLSQKWVREVKMAMNDTTPYGGYNGDEDQGQMGALGVMMSIGLFSFNGGASVKPYYEITSPIFDRIVIKLSKAHGDGEQFVIETKNNSEKNVYIQSARLNGTEWDRCWFYRDELIKGGRLEILLGSEPNVKWGITDRPPNMYGK